MTTSMLAVTDGTASGPSAPTSLADALATVRQMSRDLARLRIDLFILRNTTGWTLSADVANIAMLDAERLLAHAADHLARETLYNREKAKRDDDLQPGPTTSKNALFSPNVHFGHSEMYSHSELAADGAKSTERTIRELEGGAT